MRRLLGLALLLALLFLAIPLTEITLYAEPPLPARARAIVVLGGDSAPPRIGAETQARIDRGVALWKAGAAPLLVLTGALWDGHGHNLAPLMRARAEAEGLPAAAILQEPNSRSTLQNALFTRDLMGGDLDAPVILVTHRYHLPRAWASFRWAGFGNLTLVAADPQTPLISPRDLAWEIAKWPVNILRGGAAKLLMLLGDPERDYVWFLP